MARIFLTNIDMQNNQVINLVAEKLATDPATPATARIVYNTTSNKLEYWNGTSWVVLDNSNLNGQNAAYYLARANHTGTQLAATISDFTTAADARVAAAGYATSIGNGTLTTLPVTHNLNTRDVIVQVYQVATPYAQVYPDIAATTVNAIDLTFAVAPTANQYRVLVRKAA
jgi:5,10-methylene-tetrahydrofolate dehydrogenase/methenyl tetrahydrofolate cyclohydrolase